MSKIIMLVTSELDTDPRVQKEASLAYQAGHEVIVVGRSYKGVEMPYTIQTFDVNRRTNILAKYTERLWTNFQLLRFALASKPDIIHANDLDTLPAAFVAARWCKAKVVYDAHELWSDMGGSRAGRLGKQIALYAERFLAPRVDAVVTVSPYRAEEMVKALGIENPIVVMNVPTYIQPAQLVPREWVTEFVGKRIVLYQGRYSDGMGLAEAIMAAKYLPEDIVLVFRGFGPYEETMKQVIAREGLAPRVKLVPPVPMKDMVLSAVGADVGLVLYKPVNLNNYYAAPNKLFEYIMAGVPCVGSDLPYIREILCGSDLGVVFKPGDSEDLARAIVELLNAPERLLAMKHRCLAQSENYSWEVEGSKLLEVYQILTHK